MWCSTGRQQRTLLAIKKGGKRIKLRLLSLSNPDDRGKQSTSKFVIYSVLFFWSGAGDSAAPL